MSGRGTFKSGDEPRVESFKVSGYRVPTDRPESDGTLAWDHTTVVCARVTSGDKTGLGWTFAAKAAAAVIEESLIGAVKGRSALGVEGCWQAMVDAVRNVGRGGLCAMAISAVDVALWDLKSRLLGISLSDLIGHVRDAVPLYGSGGFTSYDDRQLAEQLGGWVAAGIGRVKMKVGREASRDRQRVAVARRAIGDAAELFVDANGAGGPPRPRWHGGDAMKHELIHEASDGLRTYVLVFDQGDEVAAKLQRLAEEMRLDAASFTAIGALESATVAWFDWGAKTYRPIEIGEQVEVLSLAGDIASKDGKPQVHAHVVLGKSDGTAHGGHLQRAVVRPTLEMVLTESPAHLRKRVDPRSGLALIHLK